MPSRQATPLRRSSPRRVGHQLGVAGGLDHEVEAAQFRESACVASGVETYRAPDAVTSSLDGSSDAVQTSMPASRSR